jgi:hypothetical protein
MGRMGSAGMAEVQGLQLLRREHEVQALDHLLEAARTGRSGTLMVLGEPGLGKTALLQRTIDSAARFQNLRTAGTEAARPASSSTAFAIVDRVIRPAWEKP